MIHQGPITKTSTVVVIVTLLAATSNVSPAKIEAAAVRPPEENLQSFWPPRPFDNGMTNDASRRWKRRSILDDEGTREDKTTTRLEFTKPSSENSKGGRGPESRTSTTEAPPVKNGLNFAVSGGQKDNGGEAVEAEQGISFTADSEISALQTQQELLRGRQGKNAVVDEEVVDYPIAAHHQKDNIVKRVKKSAKIGPRSLAYSDLLLDSQEAMKAMADLDSNVEWNWCLMAIAGNATIVKLRRDDFVRYLRMNIASLIRSDYDLVQVTSITYTPHVLVNVSLDWAEAKRHRIIKSLSGLAIHNDTLLDLSGEHFNLTDFLPASALMTPKAKLPLEEGDAAAAAADPRKMEAVIYLTIGIFVAFLLTASLLFAVCHCLVRTKSSRNNSAAQPNSQSDLLNNEVVAASTPDETNSLLVVSRRRSNHSSSRHSFMHPSPVTEETISLDDFEAAASAASMMHQNNHSSNRYSFPSRERSSLNNGLGHHRRSAPKLIYTQEFSDGLMVLPNENGLATSDDLDAADDSLAPLASFDDEAANNGYVPHQFVLRRGLQHRCHKQNRPVSDLDSPLSDFPGTSRRTRSGLLTSNNHQQQPRRPSSVLLDETSFIPPLSPPPDFNSGYCSDVPVSSYPMSSTNSRRPHPQPRPILQNGRPETPLVLSSFKPPPIPFEADVIDGGGGGPMILPDPIDLDDIPSISQPTPEEIQRDVDIVFHNMGLDHNPPPFATTTMTLSGTGSEANGLPKEIVSSPASSSPSRHENQ